MENDNDEELDLSIKETKPWIDKVVANLIEKSWPEHKEKFGVYADIDITGPMGPLFLELWNQGRCGFGMRSLVKDARSPNMKVETIVAFDVTPVVVDQPEFAVEGADLE